MAALGYVGAGWNADRAVASARNRYRCYYDRSIDAWMSVDLAEYGGRRAYYWGRHYDWPHQKLLARYLKAGDTYIDVGANLGYHTLHASTLVGDSGSVISFEPHPETYRLLTAHISINRRHNVRAYNLGLSDRAGRSAMSSTVHSGTATLRHDAAEFSGESVRTTEIQLDTGDSALAREHLSGTVFVKIDVEGNEHHVIRGMTNTLRMARYATVEITPEWLRQRGTSAEALFSDMYGLGFKSYVIRYGHRVAGLWSPWVEASPISGPVSGKFQYDVLFMR
jgi:FkbM family methyltransferase